MITESDALALLHKYGMVQKRIDHCIGVSEFALDLASRISKKHPELPVNPIKVKLAALLHDIGRCIPGDHELNTIAILKREGLDEIAAITIHGSIYEIMLLRGTDDPSLLPATIENKIVAYADSRFKNRPVSMIERWNEIETRRKGESEKIESLQMAKERFVKMEEELNSLAED